MVIKVNISRCTRSTRNRREFTSLAKCRFFLSFWRYAVFRAKIMIFAASATILLVVGMFYTRINTYRHQTRRLLPNDTKDFDDIFRNAREITKGSRCMNIFNGEFWKWNNVLRWIGGRKMDLTKMRVQFLAEHTQHSVEEFADFKKFISGLGIQPMTSGGRSGCSFYKTKDNKFLIKSVPGYGEGLKKKNCMTKFMKTSDYFTITQTNFVQEYLEHMLSGKLSMLVRYFAFFMAKDEEGNEKCWSIMNNWHSEEIEEFTFRQDDSDVYDDTEATGDKDRRRITLASDLKGSLAGREYTSEKQCWKDRDWLYLMNNVTPYHPENNVTARQNLEKYSGMVGSAIIRDVKLLRKFGLMDYSLVPKLEVIPYNETIDDEFDKPDPKTISSYKIPIEFTIPGETNGQGDKQIQKVRAFLHFGGIIDFLQRFNHTKRMEKLWNNMKGIVEHSAKSENQYADRFMIFISKFFSRSIVNRRESHNSITFTTVITDSENVDLDLPKWTQKQRYPYELRGDDEQGVKEKYDLRYYKDIAQYEESFESVKASNSCIFARKGSFQYEMLKNLQHFGEQNHAIREID